jgi:hypothetical protein
MSEHRSVLARRLTPLFLLISLVVWATAAEAAVGFHVSLNQNMTSNGLTRRDPHGLSAFGNRPILDVAGSREISVSFDSSYTEAVYASKMKETYLAQPEYMSYEVYSQQKMAYDLKRAMREARSKSYKAVAATKDGGGLAIDLPYRIKSKTFRRLFGGDNVGVRVQGDITINGSIRQQKFDELQAANMKNTNTAFRIDMVQRFTITGKVGQKVEVKVDQDSERLFDFENSLKLTYTGDEDEIIQKVEAGNVALNLGTRLATFSGRNTGLFGLKTQAKIGALSLTGIASLERGQKNRQSPNKTAQRAQFSEKQFLANTYFFLSSTDHVYMDSTRSTDLVQIPNFRENYRHYANRQHIAAQDQIYDIEVFVSTTAQSTTSDPSKLGRAAALSFIGDLSRQEFPDDHDHVRCYWKQLDKAIAYTFDPQLGVLRLRQPLSGAQMLACAFTLRSDTSRKFGTMVVQDSLALVLLRYSDPSSTDSTWNLMLRNIYSLQATSLDKNNFSLTIARESASGGREETSTPTTGFCRGGGTCSYLSFFGFDFEGQGGTSGADNRLDDYPSLIDWDKGELQFLDLTPFDPTGYWDAPNVGEATSQDTTTTYYYRRQLQKLSDAVSDTAGFLAPYLYTEKPTQYSQQGNRWRMSTEFKGSTSVFDLGPLVLEGSEEVTNNGQQLTRGIDYTIDYMSGQLRILNDAAKAPNAQLDITYESGRVFQLDKTTLLGGRAEYSLWEDSYIGGMILYLDQKTLDKRVRIGNEPIRNTLYDLNTSLKFKPTFLTRMVDALPLVRTEAASNLTFDAEVAYVIPNPNSLSNARTGDYNGLAYIDDFEGARRSTPLGMQRRTWSLASIPVDPRIDSLRGRMRWYNPITQKQVQVKDVYPNRKTNSQVANTLQSMILKFEPDTTDPVFTNRRRSWGGVMRFLGDGYSDQSLSQYLEFWIQVPSSQLNPATRDDSARLVVDLGTISEDALPNDSMDTEDIPLIERADPRLTGQGNGVLTPEEDTGLDKQFANDPNDLALWNGPSRPRVPSWDDWARPEGDNYSQVNGTEHNRTDEGGGYPDTEDLNGNGTLDRINGYFSYTFPLDTSLAHQKKYIIGEGDTGKRWFLYRIPLSDNTKVGPADLTSVKWARIYLTGFSGPTEIQLVQMDIVSNEWQTPTTDADTTERLTTAVINSHENNPGYKSPPGVEGDIDPITNLQQREQSLVLKIKKLDDEHRVAFVAKNLYQEYNLLEYKRLKMFVHGGDSLEGLNFRDEQYQLILRLGQSYTNIYTNYYDVVLTVKPGWDPTNVINVAMDTLSDLNRRRREAVALGQVSAATGRFAYAYNPEEIGDSLVIEGSPTLSRVGFLALGVRLLAKRMNMDGPDREIWVDELRVTDIYKDPGTASEINSSLQLADLLSLSGSYNNTDANFHNVNTRINASQATSSGWRGNLALNLQKFYLDRFGFQVPLTVAYSEGTTIPRVLPGSDTRISPSQAPDSVMTHQTTMQYHFQYSKSGNSKSPIVRWTAEKLQFSYDYSLDKRSDYNVEQNRSVTEGASASYNFPTSKGRGISFLGWAGGLPPLSWLGKPVFYFKPTKLSVSTQASKRTGYQAMRPTWHMVTDTSNHTTSLQRSQQITNTWQFYTTRMGSIGFAPLDPITLDFSRTYKGLLDSTKDWSSLFKWDFGQTNEVNQSLATNYTPEFASWLKPTISYTSGYTWANRNPLQENQQGVSNQRNVGTDVTFDLRSIFGGGGGSGRSRERSGGRDRGPQGEDESRLGGPERDPRGARGDSLQIPPHGSPTTPAMQTHDRGRMPNPQAVDSLARAAGDTTRSAPPKRSGSPLKSVGQILRPIGKGLLMLDPIALSYDNTASHSASATKGQARFGYQLGLTTDPAIPTVPGYTTVPALRNGEDITARSGLRLSQNIRTTFNYSHRTAENISTSRTGSVDQSMFWLGGKGKPTAFPFVDVSADWSGLEKIGFLSKATKTVSLSTALANKVTENWASNASNITTRAYTRSWNPLLGVSVTWKGDIESQIRYTSTSTYTDNVSVGGKSRNSESRIGITGGYTIHTGFRLPLFFMRAIRLQNQTTFSVTVDYSKQKTESTQQSGGQRTELWAPTMASTSWSIQPRMTYSFSQTVTGQASMTLNQTKNDITQNKTRTFEFGIQVNIAIRG